MQTFNQSIALAVQFENFLPLAVHAEILAFAIANQAIFQAASTTDNIPDYRSSQVAFEGSFPFDQWLLRPLSDKLQEALSGLSMLPFPIGQVEHQLTASGNGGFYKLHTDNGSPDTSPRVLTFVYYCSNGNFTGGELEVSAHGRTERFDPIPNSIVFFPSSSSHAVLPVANSGDWADSRFTINGWYRFGSFDTVPAPTERLLDYLNPEGAVDGTLLDQIKPESIPLITNPLTPGSLPVHLVYDSDSNS